MDPCLDLNIDELCRRWEDLLEWKDKRADAVDRDVYDRMRRPEGVRVKPIEAPEA